MTEIITKAEVEQKTYVANDGTKFDNEIECKTHENKMNETLRKAKWNKIMGNGIQCPTVEWIYDVVTWHFVTLKTYDDLIDFLSLMTDFDTYHFDSKFVDEVTTAINSGEEFKMIVTINNDGGYASRYTVKYSSGLNGKTPKERYDEYIARFDDEIRLLEEMKKYVTYSESAEA